MSQNLKFADLNPWDNNDDKTVEKVLKNTNEASQPPF